MLRRMLLLVLALVVLLGVMPGRATHAQSQSKVPEFRLSDSPNGPAVTNFGAGVRNIYAIFKYQDASGTKVTVRLVDISGMVVFERTKEYTGSGQESIEITGQVVYRSYLDQVTTRGENAVQALDRALAASGQSQVLNEMLPAVTEGNAVRMALSALSQYPVGSTTKDSLTQALARMNSFQQLTQGLNYQLSEAELRNRAQQMKEHLQAAMQLANQAKSTAGDGADFGFLATPGEQKNTAQLIVDEELAQSIEWGVMGSDVGVTSSPTPTSTGAPTRTPTSTSPAAAEPSATPVPTRTATPPITRAATQTPVRPSPTTPSMASPGATASVTLSLSATLEGFTPTAAVETPSPTVEALEGTLETLTPAIETPTVAALEGTPAVTAAPTRGVTPAMLRRATLTPATAAPATGLPLGTVGIAAGAVLLGLLALWFRRQV